MDDDPTKEPQIVPYVEQLPQTVHLTDGIRARKTAPAYVLERLKSDNTWEAFGTGGGSFNAFGVARVDPSGDDSTGTVGDLTKSFLTVQAAATAFEALDPVPDNCVFLINGVFSENVTTSLQVMTFAGNGPHDSVAFASLTLTGDSSFSIYGVNCSLVNISANTSGSLAIDVTSGGLIENNVTNSGGDVVVNGPGATGDGYSLNITAAGGVGVGNLWGWAIEVDITATGDVSSYDCLLNNVTAGGDCYMNDSRFTPGGTRTITGTTTYNDAFLGFGGRITLNLDDGSAEFLGGDLSITQDSGDGLLSNFQSPDSIIRFSTGGDITIGNALNNLAVAASGGMNVNLSGGALYISGGPTFLYDVLNIVPMAQPGSPTEGMIYADVIDHHLYFYNGTAWKQLDN